MYCVGEMDLESMTLDQINAMLIKMDGEKKAGKNIDQKLYNELDERAEELENEERQTNAEKAHIGRMIAARRKRGGGYAAPLRF